MEIKSILDRLSRGDRLDEKAFKSAFSAIYSGELNDPQIAALLMAFEIVEISDRELSLGAQIMRDHMIPVSAPGGAMDIVGTGGDGLTTFNISTACAFVCAGAGQAVAKHGNRAVSSKSGASDVLCELGVKLDIPVAKTEDCIKTAGVGFLFAPNHHKAMGHVAPARAALGIRTLFNRLGPLCNPAMVEYMLVGVYDDLLRTIYGKALLKLGCKKALIVHGSDGMDEITTTGPSNVTELKNGELTEYAISPEQFGLDTVTLGDLKGGDPKHNAKALLNLLDGAPGAYRDIVLLNSGAALYASGESNTIKAGIDKAKSSIDGGGAGKALDQLIEISNG